MPKYTLCFVTACALLSIMPTALYATDAGPLLIVDVKADRHPISPDIYGMNVFGADAGFQAFMKECRLPVNRQGGDATTRYNWKIDATNAGDDWFFMAGNGDGAYPKRHGGQIHRVQHHSGREKPAHHSDY